jgi:hypothetical protein
MTNEALGALKTPDRRHVERYPIAGFVPAQVTNVEKRLRVPPFHRQYDQRPYNACIGYSSSWMMSILNRHLYSASWLWDRAKEQDDYPHTNPGDNNGTTLRAAMDVLREVGHCRVGRNGQQHPPALVEGIKENRWATTIDEIRSCIDQDLPVVMASDWYTAFAASELERVDGRFRIRATNLGSFGPIGHAYCLVGTSDRREAVLFLNTWGDAYPREVEMPYAVVEYLLGTGASATLITDRLQ